MNLKDYIQGKRKGKEANRLEREAMNDPFLQDALDGYNAVEDNHLSVIESLEKEISQKTGARKKQFVFHHWQAISIAASIALVIGIGGFILFKTPEFEHQHLAVAEIEEEKPEKLALRKDEKESPEIFTPEPPGIKFTAPVIKMDSEVMEEVKDQEDLIVMNLTSSKADVANENDFISEEDVSDNFVMSEPAEEEAYAVDAKKMEIAATETANVRSKSDLTGTVTSPVEQKSVASKPFGKTEFVAYFNKNRKPDICRDTTLYIKAGFYINENGYPADIHVLTSTCKALETELIRLLNQSPQWTDKNMTQQLIITSDELR